MQIKVYGWLKNNNGVFRTARQVFEGMKKDGLVEDKDWKYCRIHRALNKLTDFGFLDMKYSGSLTNWHRVYKCKKER